MTKVQNPCKKNLVSCDLSLPDPVLQGRREKTVQIQKEEVAIMKKRRMLSIIALSTAAAVGFGSAYAAAKTGLQARIAETETEETETEETETEEAGTVESERNDISFLDLLPGTSEKSAMPDGEAYEDLAVSDGMLMAAAETGGYYAEPAMPNWNTEQYSTVDETGFRDVKLYPLSTFGRFAWLDAEGCCPDRGDDQLLPL